MESLIKPAMKELGLEVIRADQIAEPLELAVDGQPMQGALHVVTVRSRSPFGFEFQQIGVDMIGKRRPLVVDYRIFGSGEHFAFDQHGPAF